MTQVISNRIIGNNGNQVIGFMHEHDLLKDGMTAEQIAEIIKPYMINPNHLFRDDLWEDVFYRADELGYKLKY